MHKGQWIEKVMIQRFDQYGNKVRFPQDITMTGDQIGQMFLAELETTSQNLVPQLMEAVNNGHTLLDQGIWAYPLGFARCYFHGVGRFRERGELTLT